VTDGKLYNGFLTGKRPDGVGMMHFNGGGSSKNNAFENNSSSYLNDPKHHAGWGNANYYIRLPWPYAKFITESMKEGDGYPLVIHYNTTK
jgi:hypothetical protein